MGKHVWGQAVTVGIHSNEACSEGGWSLLGGRGVVGATPSCGGNAAISRLSRNPPWGGVPDSCVANTCMLCLCRRSSRR